MEPHSESIQLMMFTITYKKKEEKKKREKKSHVEIHSSSQWKEILFYLMVYKIPSPTTQITVKRSLIYPFEKREKKKKFYKPLFLLSNHTDIKSYCKKRGGMPLLSITAAAVWQK